MFLVFVYEASNLGGFFSIWVNIRFIWFVYEKISFFLIAVMTVAIIMADFSDKINKKRKLGVTHGRKYSGPLRHICRSLNLNEKLTKI